MRYEKKNVNKILKWMTFSTQEYQVQSYPCHRSFSKWISFVNPWKQNQTSLRYPKQNPVNLTVISQTSSPHAQKYLQEYWNMKPKKQDTDFYHCYRATTTFENLLLCLSDFRQT